MARQQPAELRSSLNSTACVLITSSRKLIPNAIPKNKLLTTVSRNYEDSPPAGNPPVPENGRISFTQKTN